MNRFSSCRPTVLPVRGRRNALRLLALAALACTALTASVTSVHAATPDTVFDTVGVDSPDMQPFARFPERLIDTGDLTGDGVRDVWASSYLIDVAGVENAGKVVLINGATQEIVREITSPELRAEAPNAVPPAAGGQNGPQFGFYISVPGDVDGDRKDDLVVGAPYQDIGAGCAVTAPEPNDGCNENQGKAYVFSGADGDLLYDIDNPNPQPDEGVFATFGARIGQAGDVTGDGVGDIIIGSPAQDVPQFCGYQAPFPAGCRKNEGESFVFDGETGDRVRTYNVPTIDRQEPECTGPGIFDRCGNMSVSQSPGDIDRDGVGDHLVAAYSLKRPSLANVDFFGRVYLFSGKTGALLARIDQPVPDGNAFWGLMDLAPNTPGDVTGDGVPDLYVSGFLQDGPDGEPSAGRGWVFDGAATVAAGPAAGRAVVKYSPKDPTPRPSEAFGFTASRTDYNKDATPDLYLSGLSGQNTAPPTATLPRASCARPLALDACRRRSG